MSAFDLLSRGANLDRAGKHKKDLDLFRPEPAETRTTKSANFFHLKGKDEKESEMMGEEEMDEEEEGVEVGMEDGQEEVQTEEQAQKYRRRHRIRTTGDDVPFPLTVFSSLAVATNVVHTTPTPIQSQAIPVLLHGRDLLACAPTGSGKTLAFVAPVVQLVAQRKKIKEKIKEKKTKKTKKTQEENDNDGPSQPGLTSVIISPTKELAQQIYDETLKLCKGTDVKAAVLTKAEAAKLRADKTRSRRHDILVATPMRLLDCLTKECLDLSTVRVLIFDEADRLFEQEFVQQTDQVLAACTNPRLQRAMFSATLPSHVEQLAQSIMVAPIRIVVGLKEAAAAAIEQQLIFTGSEEGKLIAIRQLFAEGKVQPPAIVFVQSIPRAKALFHELLYDKVNVDAIHGEKTAAQRKNVVDRFRAGDIWVLICTDVLARGIDFQGVNLVLNYDVPQSSQSYVHRIGRTGRAGRQGKAITFYTKDDQDAVKNVINVMKQSGTSVEDWMLNLPKLGRNTKKQIKRKPQDRAEISTVPKVVKRKREQRKDMIRASKRRAEEEEN